MAGGHLNEWAWFGGNPQRKPHEQNPAAFERLSALAHKENWGNHNSILANYIDRTFSLATIQQKLFQSPSWACFATGLYTANTSWIFAVFRRVESKSSKPNQREWVFSKWETQEELARERDNGSPALQEPQRVTYYKSVLDIIFNPAIPILVDGGKVLDGLLQQDRLHDLYPVFSHEISQDVKETIVKGMIENAKTRAIASPRTIVPQYYRGKIQLLLPLWNDRGKVLLALPLELQYRPGEDLLQEKDEDSLNGSRPSHFEKPQLYTYSGNTIVSLRMAYSHARLLNRIESEWLRPQMVSAKGADIDGGETFVSEEGIRRQDSEGRGGRGGSGERGGRGGERSGRGGERGRSGDRGGRGRGRSDNIDWRKESGSQG